MLGRLLLVAMLFAACHRTPAPKPQDLMLDGPGTYRAFLQNLVEQVKMRHQVASQFADRNDVIDGFLIMQRPGRFWVRAMAGFGTNLFDVRADPGRELVVQIHLKQLKDEKLARYLARDIRRIYLVHCPENTPVEAAQDTFIVRCDIRAEEDYPIEGDPSDDALALHLDRSGLLSRKIYYRSGKPTAAVEYKDYRKYDQHWLATRIELVHHQLPYRFTIGLVDADVHFDAQKVFERADGT